MQFARISFVVVEGLALRFLLSQYRSWALDAGHRESLQKGDFSFELQKG
jgi:hypothetical protein